MTKYAAAKLCKHWSASILAFILCLIATFAAYFSWYWPLDQSYQALMITAQCRNKGEVEARLPKWKPVLIQNGQSPCYRYERFNSYFTLCYSDRTPSGKPCAGSDMD